MTDAMPGPIEGSYWVEPGACWPGRILQRRPKKARAPACTR